jgi:hypothetical protein
MRKGKDSDPDPEPYSRLMFLDPSGPKNIRIRIPNTALINENVQGDVEEAVFRARLDWLKRMVQIRTSD